MLSKNSEFHIKHFNITWINLICSNPEQNINATSKPSVYVYLKKNFVNCGTMLPPGRKWLAHPLWTAQMAQPYRWNLGIKNHLDVGHNIISRKDWKIVTSYVGGKRQWQARRVHDFVAACLALAPKKLSATITFLGIQQMLKTWKLKGPGLDSGDSVIEQWSVSCHS